jgi:hypothetical protein
MTDHIRTGGHGIFRSFFRLAEAGRNDEARDAIIGFDASSRLLFVVHVQIEDECSHHFRPQGDSRGKT